jgi:hypothetical protein
MLHTFYARNLQILVIARVFVLVRTFQSTFMFMCKVRSGAPESLGRSRPYSQTLDLARIARNG